MQECNGVTIQQRRRQRDREGRKKKERKRQRGRERHQTLMLLRKRLSRSQSVACAEVQASAFKALAGSAPTKKLAQRLDSFVRVSRRVERDQKKKRVHVSWSITSGARNGRLWSQAVFSRQSRCTGGLEAPRSEIFV